MRRLQSIHPSGTLLAFILAVLLTVTLVALLARPAHGEEQTPASFHIVNITKLMAGYNGDTSIQAVELKMTAGGQNLVNGLSIAAYNGSGALLATLGTFAGNVPNALNGDRILCATTNFRDTFGIIPDLIITPGIPITSGQVAFETPGCRVNVLPYGTVPTPLTSPTAAPPLPSQGATALVRTVDSPTALTCPLAEDAGNRFALTSGGPGHPIVFTNNARASVSVLSTVTGVGGTPAERIVRASPNPFRGATVIEAPDWRPLSIYDIRGRLVRVLTCVEGGACPDVFGPFSGEWDGTDNQGRPVPSGIYFLRYAGANGTVVTRMALTR